MVFAVVVILAAVIIIGWFIGQSNRLNRYVVSIEESKKTVDITLAKRYDTISEMLKVAKAYAKHEEKVFTELVGLRQSASIQETNRAMANQNDVLSQIRAVAENYPDLMSSQQFLTLQKEIASENNELAASKRIVNSNVRVINQAIVSFPTSVVAGCKGMRKFDFLEEDLEGKKDLKDLDYNID
ncbi:LemA family protein [Shuttleworthella satelles]|uniref:LemA family protein n=1 Tax=Shuttleworthella satelles TaxID=177972 RepID=UPI0028D67E12|nr:LemA family protein [Shuttleworthia satelles]